MGPNERIGIATSKSLCLPYPLRDDYLAQIVIPRDMNIEEASSLFKFIMSLAIPEKVRRKITSNPVEVLQWYINKYPAFRAKPEGAPESLARKEQELSIKMEDLACFLIAEFLNEHLQSH